MFKSIYDKEVYTMLYLDCYYYVTFKDSKSKNIFLNKLSIKTLKNDFCFDKDVIKKEYVFNNDSFNKIFNNPTLKEYKKFYKGISILSYYDGKGFVIVNIVNKNNYSKIKILDYLKELFKEKIIGIFIFENKKIINYYFEFDTVNDLIKKEIKRNYFIDFLDIVINKGNLNVRKNSHFY